jgi:hypothetical protein
VTLLEPAYTPCIQHQHWSETPTVFSRPCTGSMHALALLFSQLQLPHVHANCAMHILQPHTWVTDCRSHEQAARVALYAMPHLSQPHLQQHSGCESSYVVPKATTKSRQLSRPWKDSMYCSTIRAGPSFCYLGERNSSGWQHAVQLGEHNCRDPEAPPHQ